MSLYSINKNFRAVPPPQPGVEPTERALGVAEMFGLGLDHDVQLPALLGAVTRDDVSDVARRFLAPERATVAIAGPYEPSSLASPGTAVRPA